MSKFDLQSAPDKRRSMLIWDAEGSPPVGDGTTVLWSSFGENDDSSVISIPKLVEEQADALRARYLAWIYELGETRLKGKRLVDHLELRAGFSFWWMTSLAQKFNASGTSQINNAIKAFVLEMLVLEYKPISIVLVSSNDKVASTLQSFCQKLKLRFRWDVVKSTEKPKSFVRRIYDSLPCPMRAIISFSLYLFKSLSFILTKQTALAFNGKITFIDVLVHLNKETFTTNNFVSNYWTTIVDKLLQSNVKTNWIHNYFYQESIPSLVRAQGLIRCFTKCSLGIHTHALADEALSLSVFVKALKDYFRISFTSVHFLLVSRHFVPIGSVLNFWPLFKHEWIASLRGQEAMVNCLRLSLYEKTFSRMPYQSHGVYIQENQPWEMALIYAWKAAGHGKLIGAPHTTVRYWDLRYFYDPRSFEPINDNILPFPDIVAVNGPVAKKVYLEGGYPESQITEVEALRFLHLLNRSSEHTSMKSPSKTLKVLICGDFLSSTNQKMLSWLSIAAKSLPPETSYVLKPHPAYPVKMSDFRSITFEMSDVSLAELFADCDVVFTSNISSAAVDAYCSGIPIVQMLDGESFNMSPLRGLTGVVYVTSSTELTVTLRNIQHYKCVVAEPYFYLDKDLPRWWQLLSLSPANAKQFALKNASGNPCHC